MTNEQLFIRRLASGNIFWRSQDIARLAEHYKVARARPRYYKNSGVHQGPRHRSSVAWHH